MTRLAWVLAAFGLLAAAPVHAQLFKCKGPDGKIVYSDQRCESSAAPAAVTPGVSNRAHAIEEKAAQDKAAAEKAAADAQRAAEALVAAQQKAAAEARKLAPPAPVAAPTGAAPGAAVPVAAAKRAPGSSAAEQERLRNLQSTLGQSNLTPEQKSAAQMEMDAIRSGRDSELSSADRERREALSADLRSLDRNKRQEALRQLRNLY